MNVNELRETILKQKEAADRLLRDKALQNLFIFNKYILKAEEGDNKVPLAPFHRQLCNFVQDSTDKKKLILVPRLHLKSTLVTVGYSVFNILKNPNIRILILSATYENAADFVGAIKDHLSRNETLIGLYGNVAKNPIEWSNNRITLRTNRTAVGDKEPTVLGAGIETNVVSKHFDMVILDDVVVRENTETIEQIDKVVRRYRDTINLMDTKSQLIVIGTRWVDNDLYSWLLDPENEQRPQYLVYLRKALEWDGDLNEALRNGTGFIKSLWEAKFTRGVLLQKYITSGPYEFSTQYLNDPVPDSEATFNKGWFKPYEEADIRGDFINNYLTIDPAISTKAEADYTAMVVTGVDRWGNIYIRDIVREHFTPNEIINTIFKLSDLWHPKQIGLEEVAWQKTLSYSMREEMRRRGRSLPIIPVKPGARSKDERIRGLQPLYANGKIFHNRSLPNTRYLEDELMRFPRAKHDDIIDALSYTLDFFTKPRSRSYDRLNRGGFMYNG